jgi:hypothetical protein
MSKKHFIALAKEIAAEPDEAKRRFACETIVKVAEQDNASFDANRFRHACGLPLKMGLSGEQIKSMADDIIHAREHALDKF